MAEEPNFKLAREIAPALAGIVVDWSIGAKEITATLVDLIVKKNLLVIGETICVSNRTFDYKFEKEFVQELFDRKKELTFGEVSSLAYHERSEILIKTIDRGLVDEGIIRRDFQKVLAGEIKNSIKKAIPGAKIEMTPETKTFRVKPRTLKLLGLFYLILQFIVILDLVGIFLLKDSVFGLIGAIILMPLIVIDLILAIPALILLWLYGFTRSVSPNYEIILTEDGKEIQREMRNLKKFIETHPLYEDRLANVLVGHAIAFGVGKIWMQKLGAKNASFLKLLERLESEDDTTTYLIDFESYLKEFSKN